MIDTSSHTGRNWEEKWVTIRGVHFPRPLIIPYDVERETFYRKNLIANRGRYPVNTDDSSCLPN